MKIKIKFFKQIIALLMALFIVINPVLLPVIAYAEDVTPTPTVEQVTPTSAPENTPTTQPTSESIDSSVTPTPTPANSLTTGQADSLAVTDTTANNNQDTIPGLITSAAGCTPPEGQTTCPDNIAIGNSNQADTASEATSSASTGDNLSTGSLGGALINTSDANAIGLLKTEANTNIVELAPSSNSNSTTNQPNETNTTNNSSNNNQTNSDPKTLTVDNINDVISQNNADIKASTGNNITADNLGDAKINTGDATAIANLINLLNTNIVGSNFQILVLDIIADQNGDIDLNKIWQSIIIGQDGSLKLVDNSTITNLQFYIYNQNNAKLENNVTVNASTGSNEANNNENTVINTGDAKAVVNVNNFVNTNIFGSNFFFGIINIVGNYSGNLILPRQELFTNSISNNNSYLSINNNNQATTNDNVSTLANSGENQSLNTGETNSTTTGNAIALSNSTTIANTNAWLNNLFWFNVNNLGGWNGQTYGWSSPGAVENNTFGTTTFQNDSLNSTGSSTPEDNGQINEALFSEFNNFNQAEVTDNISVIADSGLNKANNNTKSAVINTGNAFASANLFNLINTNIVGGNWFMGMINILGGWTGNTIFAYPDVVVGLDKNFDEAVPGDEVGYTVRIKNQGYDEAKDVRIRVDLPQGLSLVSNDSGYNLVSTDGFVWEAGSLKPGEIKSFHLSVKVNSDFSFDQQISFWSKLIPTVQAADKEKEKEIVVKASVYTTDPESNSANNSTSVSAIVYQPESTNTSSNDSVTDDQPEFSVTVTNNVGEFVYPGDVVTFEAKIKNIGKATSYNTRMVQKLYNGGPEGFGTVSFDLGTMLAGEGGVLTFGIQLPDDGSIPEDEYRTVAVVTGKAPNDNTVTTGDYLTYFTIKFKYQPLVVEEVEAADDQPIGEVLGASTTCPSAECQKQEREILPYILLFIISATWFTNRARTKFFNK